MMVEGHEHLPGHDLVDAGIADLHAGRATASAALVAMARPRLRNLGLDVPEEPNRGNEPAGHRLYALLAADNRATAHSQYNALVRRMVSYAQAAEHARSSRR